LEKNQPSHETDECEDEQKVKQTGAPAQFGRAVLFTDLGKGSHSFYWAAARNFST